jgi:hypothetical protein
MRASPIRALTLGLAMTLFACEGPADHSLAPRPMKPAPILTGDVATTLGHVRLEATTARLIYDYPGEPTYPVFGKFSCESAQTIVDLDGTAIAEDQSGREGSLRGLAFLAGIPLRGDMGAFSIEGAVDFGGGALWSGYVSTQPATYNPATGLYEWPHGQRTCTIVDGIMEIGIVSEGRWVAATGLGISSGGPAQVNVTASIASDMKLVSFTMTMRLLDQRDPNEVVLSPALGTGALGGNHTITATVRDFVDLVGIHNPAAGVPVIFAVNGSEAAGAVCTTNTAGQCSFTYAGPLSPRRDEITAYADGNGDGRRTTGEPSAVASMIWGDAEPPTIEAPPPLNVATSPGACVASISPATLGTATVTDNVGVASVTRSPGGDLFSLGSTTVTWTATDDAGNSASARQAVTVTDAQAPSITVPADIDLAASSSVGTVIHGTDLGSSAASDNCPIVTVAVDGLPAGDLFPIGSTTVIWTATDASGNVASESQKVVVGYKVCPLYDPTRTVRQGSTVPIKLQLCTTGGVNLSRAGVVVHAVALARTSGTAIGLLDDAGTANPDLDFRFDESLGGYIFNLSTKELAAGTWQLSFTVDGMSSSRYRLPFQLK